MNEIIFGNNSDVPVCLALGYFDSVHAGHRSILSDVVKCSTIDGFKSAVFTFENNMYANFVSSEKQIYTYDERCKLFSDIGLDYVVHAKFDEIFRKMSANEFLNILFSSLNIQKLYCGYDYRFGYMGKGDIAFLSYCCAVNGVELEIVPKVEYCGKRVSTTWIKELLSHGDIVLANKLLKSDYFISGKVISGRKVGHLYGFPTANIEVSPGKMLPQLGVYATVVTVDKRSYKAVTNVGNKPTFGENTISVESFLSGLTEDLYDKNITVEFVKRLRDIQKFNTPTELAKQIHEDLEQSKKC